MQEWTNYPTINSKGFISERKQVEQVEQREYIEKRNK